jgi:hypothetical protein
MTTLYKIVNGERYKLTTEEIAEVEAKNVEWNNGAKNRAMVSLRNKRNDLLKETDFYALSDVTMSTEMTTYRQALRDLPSTISDDDTAEDVDNVTFPTKPSGG